ncbi:hypothetical protein E2542_SST05396 [Spatholobus suberectus]|nr:hypothetical protein E2542_SST05396 [Spatholobus suberectus]
MEMNFNNSSYFNYDFFSISLTIFFYEYVFGQIRSRMDFPLDSEDQVMLQLRKWDPFETRIGLLDFRKAFLYPTREILLLYSHEREALSLPLSKEDDIPSKAAKVDSIKSVCSAEWCHLLWCCPQVFHQLL